MVLGERSIMKIITIDPNKCTGCRLCELACSLRNFGECNPARAKIRVIGFDEMFVVPLLCMQCERPFCAEVCPSGAITKEEGSGVIKIAKEKCVGCKICTLACPFGNIVFSTEEHVAVKCDLCGGEPECVAFCPTEALEYREADTAAMSKKMDLAERLRTVYEGVQSS